MSLQSSLLITSIFKALQTTSTVSQPYFCSDSICLSSFTKNYTIAGVIPSLHGGTVLHFHTTEFYLVYPFHSPQCLERKKKPQQSSAMCLGSFNHKTAIMIPKHCTCSLHSLFWCDNYSTRSQMLFQSTKANWCKEKKDCWSLSPALPEDVAVSAPLGTAASVAP